MKKQIILTLCCLAAWLFAYEWEQVYTATGQYEDFEKLYFFSPDTGFATGYGITATTDGGKSWKRVTDDLALTYAITFTDSKHGFATCRWSPYLRYTEDGGKSWQGTSLSDSLSNCYYRNILFLDSLTGFLPGGYGNIYPVDDSHGQILKTIDGGKNWRRVLYTYEDKINDIVVDPKSGHLYAAGGPNPGAPRAWIAKSYDNGEHWRVKLLEQIRFELTDLQFIDEDNLFASSYRYFCQLDSSLTIKNYQFNQGYDSINFRNIRFMNSQKGFLINENTTNYPLYKTENGGKSWEKEIAEKDKYYDVCIIDSVIYAATSTKLYKTKTTTSIRPETAHTATAAYLKAYPNPFNCTTLINYHLSAEIKITLALYNVKGELVKQLFNGPKPPGSHDISLNSGALNSGVYYLRLNGRNLSLCYKILLLK